MTISASLLRLFQKHQNGKWANSRCCCKGRPQTTGWCFLLVLCRILVETVSNARMDSPLKTAHNGQKFVFMTKFYCVQKGVIWHLNCHIKSRMEYESTVLRSPDIWVITYLSTCISSSFVWCNLFISSTLSWLPRNKT